MRKTLIDVFVGVAFIIIVTILQFIASLLFGIGDEIYDDPALRGRMVNLLFLATALPAAFLGAVAAHLLKTASVGDAAIRGGVWSGIQAVSFLAMGLLNETTGFIFGAYGFYLFLIAMAAGPVVYALVKRLPVKAVPEAPGARPE